MILDRTGPSIEYLGPSLWGELFSPLGIGLVVILSMPNLDLTRVYTNNFAPIVYPTRLAKVVNPLIPVQR